MRRRALSFDRLRPVGAVRDDAYVDAGKAAHERREERAAEDLALPALVGRADEHVGRAALVRDTAHDVDEAVALFLEEVAAEDDGEPPQRGERDLLLFGQLLARPSDPHRVHLRAEALGRAPR